MSKKKTKKAPKITYVPNEPVVEDWEQELAAKMAKERPVQPLWPKAWEGGELAPRIKL